MGGGLLQLVAFGAQDVYLTGNPQITYFKVLFKRHTNFAIEPIAQSFSGTVRYGSKVTAVISRNGDLLGDMWLEAVMTKDTGNTYYPGEQLIKSVELELGGQRLDRMTSTWYRFYDNFYRNNSTERDAYRAMVDFVDGENEGAKKRMFIPVLFWCCRSPGNYLPLIALQYHEVRVTFEFEDAANIPGIDATEPLSAELWCDYVYLDQAERKKYATSSHEFLIEQIQYTGDENVTIGVNSQKSQQIRLSFNHPTKLLCFCVAHPTTYGKVTGGSPGATAESLAPIANVKLLLNGHDRAALRTGAVYNKIIPYQANKAKPDAGFYFISFALSPTQHAPSGSLNFSRIDSAVLQLQFKAAKTGYTAVANVMNENETVEDAKDLSALRVMAVNYNILRVMSGMGGLNFSS